MPNLQPGTSQVSIQGVPHVFDVTGADPAAPLVVFIHGWLLSRSYWQPLTARLSSRFQCLTYDLRGFGESQGQGGSGHTPADYAADLVSLLQTLGVTQTWLVGHSLGGTIALWAAHSLPDRVQGVVCLNAGGGIYLRREFARFRWAGTKIIQLRSPWLRRLPLLDWVFARANVAQGVGRRWGRQRLRDLLIADRVAAIDSLLGSTTEEQVHCLPRLVAQLVQPIYFMAGDQDQVMEPQYVRHLASFHHLFAGHGANVTELCGCGHMSMIEQPDRVADLITKILLNHQLEFKPQ